jgi:hypothetical protein
MRSLAMLAFVLLAPLQAAAQMMPMMPMMPMMTPSYQGLWWNAPAGSESGWGVNITHQGNILFATWFTYDADGSGMWLVMPRGELMMTMGMMGSYGYGYGEMDGALTYSGPLYRTTGPSFDSASFDPASVIATAVGSATFRFMGEDDGTFAYSVNGVSQTKPIVRQVFSALPVCAFGTSAGAAPNFEDLWWKSPARSESGWGVNLTHQGDILFATWFTYDAGGRGLWLVMPSGLKTGDNVYAGTLYHTTGPAFNASPWDPAQVTSTAVGSATFSFTDANSGTFSATVGATSQSKSITRQVYSAPVTVCR